MRIRAGWDLKTLLLRDRYKVARLLQFPPEALFRYQLAISHRQLEITSPTKILKKEMAVREIPAVVLDSPVVDFYDDALRNHPGVSSSTLAYKQGKTITCLSVLSRIEKENATVEKDRKAVFLYIDVSKTGGKITDALKLYLHIQEKESLYQVLSTLDESEHGFYKIYAVIDQVDQWYEQDKPTLKSWFTQRFNNIRIHIPTAFEHIGAEINELNGQRMAVHLGPASPTLRHDLNASHARDYVKLLTEDAKLQGKTMERVMQRVHNDGYIAPIDIIELYIKEKEAFSER